MGAAGGHDRAGGDAGRRLKPSPGHLRKRSFALAGHRTSVALEPAFWAALEAVAERRGGSLAELVAALDAARTDPTQPLASALRLFALEIAGTGR